MAMEFPSDLVEEILSLLPATSLARLRHTCKQWKTLIANPRFVNKHSSHMRCREKQFTVFNNAPYSKAPYLSGSTVSFVGDELKEHAGLNMQVFEPISFPNLSVIKMFHCDGLLLYVTKSGLLVLNPLLKQARWIVRGCEFDHPTHVFGLGYISNQSSSKPRIRKVEVYEFSSDYWREVVIVDKTFDGFYQLPFSSVCLRGTPYWIGYDVYGGTTISTRSFDFSIERFEPLFLPPSIGLIKSEDSLFLGIFRGDHLSLLHKSCETSKIHIWVRRNHWSWLMTVDIPGVSMFRIYASYFTENNSKLVVSGRHLKTKSVSIYNVGENEKCQKS
ncbi:unnamed protein product [Arabis nemorensis]|uniref:F-box domain-containing protein n=1 Tax=Arabis nemorensis TaxID=586526 RepID=A0A565ANR8_9BRAS|nr:unnamed protein product [Arabis nemorensis]